MGMSRCFTFSPLARLVPWTVKVLREVDYASPKPISFQPIGASRKWTSLKCIRVLLISNCFMNPAHKGLLDF